MMKGPPQSLQQREAIVAFPDFSNLIVDEMVERLKPENKISLPEGGTNARL